MLSIDTASVIAYRSSRLSYVYVFMRSLIFVESNILPIHDQTAERKDMINISMLLSCNMRCEYSNIDVVIERKPRGVG